MGAGRCSSVLESSLEPVTTSTKSVVWLCTPRHERRLFDKVYCQDLPSLLPRKRWLSGSCVSNAILRPCLRSHSGPSASLYPRLDAFRTQSGISRIGVMTLLREKISFVSCFRSSDASSNLALPCASTSNNQSQIGLSESTRDCVGP